MLLYPFLSESRPLHNINKFWEHSQKQSLVLKLRDDSLYPPPPGYSSFRTETLLFVERKTERIDLGPY